MKVEVFVNLRFERRKISQFRQENTVTVSAVPQGMVRLARILRERRHVVGSDPANSVFRGFNSLGGQEPKEVATKRCGVEAAGLLPLIMRGLPWSYGVIMEPGTLLRPNNVI
jgi:hypothetical protein